MRVYLRDSERRPDPAPVRTDDRSAVLTGVLLWLAGLVTTILAVGTSGDLMWACVAGIGLGVALLVYAEGKRRKG